MYGYAVLNYAQLAHEGVVEDGDKFAVVAIIFVMALIVVFLSIMGVFASNERNSGYMQVHAQYNDLFVGFVSFILLASVVEFLFF